jgi:hypothetical protein
MGFNKFQDRVTTDAKFNIFVANDVDGITSIDVVDGGSNYMVGDVLAVINGSSSSTGLTITVTGIEGGYSPSVAGVGAITSFTYVEDAGWVSADSGEYTVAGATFTLGSDYVDHTEYELGGNVQEYISGSGLLVEVTAVDGDGGVTGVDVATNDNSKNYIAGSQVRVIQGDNDTALLSIDTVDTAGKVLTLSVLNLGEGYTAEDDLVASEDSLKTDSPEVYWQGTFTGIYDPNAAPSTTNKSNDPRITVARPADKPQLAIQKGYIDGGKTVVYAEPTLVDANGEVVGNTLRAEDMTDRPRCEANGFIWEIGSTGDADQGGYGYCREMTVAEAVTFWAGNATSFDDCPAGTIFDGTDSCVALDATSASASTINAAVTSGDLNEEKAMRDCEVSGSFWDITTGTCIAGDTPANFDMGTFTFGSVTPGKTGSSNGSKRDYLANACRNLGYIWKYDTNTCVASPTQAELDLLTTQVACKNAGFTWIAGTCYNPNDFGDGQNRAATAQQDPNVAPK